MEKRPFITPERNLNLAQPTRPSRGQVSTSASTSTPSSRELKPLPKGIVIERCKTANRLAGFRRLNTVLLPLPYPDRFYREILDDNLTRELTRVAILYEDGDDGHGHGHGHSHGHGHADADANDDDDDDDGVRGKRKRSVVIPRYSGGRRRRGTSGRVDPDEGDEKEAEAEVEGKVIGGIRCRLEDVDDGISHLTGGMANTIAVAAANALIPSYPTSSSPSPSSSSSMRSSSLADDARRGRRKKTRRKRIYIQTLAVLAPFRSEGIGSHLLNAIINSSLSSSSSSVLRRSVSSSSTITTTLISDDIISPAPPLIQQQPHPPSVISSSSSSSPSLSSNILHGEIAPVQAHSLDYNSHPQGRPRRRRQQRAAEEEEEEEDNDDEDEEIIIEDIYAHVWQQNQAALEWYAHRGFLRTGPVVENYYRRLNPAGAFLLRLPLSHS